MNLFSQTKTIYSSLFLRLLARRGFENPEAIEAFLHPDLSRLYDPLRMKGMEEAVKRLRAAIEKKESILVHGDYDVDGITGAAVLMRTLSSMGATVEVFLPERKKDGYGVSAEAIRDAHARGVSLLVTVDCGVSAHAEIALARSLGLDVLIIDHHRVSAEGLPPEAIILNPLQEGCLYPFKELSAGGLAFKLSQALVGEDAYQYLDLGALSTIGDVAPLKDENRVIVREGLRALSERKNAGILALAQVAGIKTREINVGHVGFVLGPRLNAAGRMSSADIALRLLVSSHAKEAESLARVLDEENRLRQKQERQIVKEAIQETEKTFHFNRDRVIVVGREGWHAGVIGIVASRLVEKYHRPAFVIAFDGDAGKASGRSIKGFHLYQALECCKDSLKEFGGHELAAGFSIQKQKMEIFRKQVNAHAAETYDAETFIKKTRFDLEISLGDLKGPFIEELQLCEPHGAGNPRPVFLTRNLKVKAKPQQLSPQTIKFWVTDGFLTGEAIWFDRTGNGSQREIEKDASLDLIYSVKKKVWDGRESLVLEVKQVTPGSD